MKNKKDLTRQHNGSVVHEIVREYKKRILGEIYKIVFFCNIGRNRHVQ